MLFNTGTVKVAAAALAAACLPHSNNVCVTDHSAPPSPSLSPPHPSGASQAACGGQARDEAGALPPPLVTPAAHVAHPVIVIKSSPTNPQERGLRLVVAKKSVSKKAEQAHRRRARDPVACPAPTCPYRPTSSPFPSRCISFHPRNTASILLQIYSRLLSIPRTTESSLTASSARSKSPRSFSTQTRRPQQQWRRRNRRGRRGGHSCVCPPWHDTRSYPMCLSARR